MRVKLFLATGAAFVCGCSGSSSNLSDPVSDPTMQTQAGITDPSDGDSPSSSNSSSVSADGGSAPSPSSDAGSDPPASDSAIFSSEASLSPDACVAHCANPPPQCGVAIEDDGCGGTIQCQGGTCPLGTTCGSGSTANECVSYGYDGLFTTCTVASVTATDTAVSVTVLQSCTPGASCQISGDGSGTCAVMAPDAGTPETACAFSSGYVGAVPTVQSCSIVLQSDGTIVYGACTPTGADVAGTCVLVLP